MNNTIGYNLFTTRDAKFHSAIKQPVASAYGFKSALEFEPIVDDCTNLMVRRLDEDIVQSKDKKACNLSEWMQYCQSSIRNQSNPRPLADFWQMHST